MKKEDVLPSNEMEYKEWLRSYIERHHNTFGVLKRPYYKALYDFIMKQTNSFPIESSFPTRIFCYINDITELPKCSCGKEMINVRNIHFGFPKYCSVKCAANSEENKEHRRQSFLTKYGVENPNQLDSVKNKIKQTCLAKYGTEYALQAKEIREQIKKTNLEKYGVENVAQSEHSKEKYKETCLKKYGVESTNQLESVKTKKRETFQEHYGVDWGCQCEEIRNRIEQSCLNNYGVKRALQNPDILKKQRNTTIERYGTEFYTQSEEYKERLPKILELTRATQMERYGVPHFSQRPDAPHRIGHLYTYDGFQFDSSWEVAFYILHRDKGDNIIPHPNFTIPYFDPEDNKDHVYHPDFILNGEIYEIKGSHFFNENGELINPFSNQKLDAKFNCMKEHNVHIISCDEIEPYLTYVTEKYGKNFITSLRIS